MKNKAKGCQCADCPLRNEPFVPPCGSEDAKFVLIGEAPGRQEVEAKRPFVGMSGQLLDRVLERIGVRRDSLWVTNVVLCRPPNNRTPSKEEVTLCSGHLMQELKLGQVLIPMGAVALSVFIQKAKVGLLKERGKWIAWQGHNVLPTVHPAYVLRNGSALTELEQDLAKAFECELPKNPEGDFVFTDNRQQVEQWLRDHNEEPLVLDLETTGLNPRKDKILLCALCSSNGDILLTDCNLSKSRTFKMRLEQEGFIGHNAKFDAHFLRLQWGIHAPIFDDTMLMHYMLDERRGTHGLKDLAVQLLNASAYTINVVQLTEINQNLLEYAAKDVQYTRQLYNLLTDKLLEYPGLCNLYNDIMLPIANLYTEIEETGLPFDESRAKKLHKTLTAELAVLRAEFGEVNPASPAQIAELLYHDLELPIQVTKEGKVTTNEAALLELQTQTQHPILGKILDYRAKSKILSTYVEGLLNTNEHGRVYSEFLLHGTITGRPSSHDPNLLNIPRSNDAWGKQVKDLFCAPKGQTFVQADYSQQEIRVLAYYADDPTLKEIFKQGWDVHTETARRIFNVEEPTKPQRSAAKAVVFGLMYGLGTGSLAKKLGVTYKEAQSFVDRFFEQMPNCRTWQRNTEAEAVSKGRLSTITGRTMRLGLVSRDTMEDYRNRALNFRIQSTSADITYMAMLAMYEELTQLDAKIVLSVYDSVLVLCPKKVAKRVGKIMQRNMIEVAEGWMPTVKFAADVEVGERWGSLTKLS